MLSSKKSRIKLIALLLAIFISISTIAFAVSTESEVVTTSIDENTSEAVPISLDDESNPVVTSTNEENVDLISALPDAIDSDLFKFENVSNINTDVSGNVFIMAKEVNINSYIEGNVFILAESVNIGEDAVIANSAFICAKDIKIAGTIADLYCTASNVQTNTTSLIVRTANIAGASVELNGHIMKNANISCDSIVVNDTAKINGNLSYSAPSEISINEALVDGSVTFDKVDSEELAKNRVSSYVKDLLSALILALIVVLIVVFAAPKFVEKEHYILTKKTLVSLGCGALAMIVVPLACLLLLFTIIGIIPAIAIFFTFVFAIAVAPAIVAIPLGKMLCNKFNKKSNGYLVLMSMICVLVINLITSIPIIGGFFTLIVSLFGLGIFTYLIFNNKKVSANENTETIESK